MMLLNERDGHSAVSCAGDRLSAVASFPNPGVTYLRVSGMMNGSSSSVADIGQAISHDSEIADRLLKLANSAIFGFSSEIESIPRAISMIGTRGLRDLMVACAWGEALSRIGNECGRTGWLWRHSLHCAILARLAARHLRIPYIEPLFVSGLLHDVGLFASNLWRTNGDGLTIERAHGVHRPPTRFAHDSDMRHGVVATELLSEWGLSPAILEPIACHHDARQAKKYARFSAILQITDIALTDALEAVPGYLWSLSGLHQDEMRSLRARSHDILNEVNELFS